ncbi:replication restart DNA helicase PriA [Alteromonadaceae bacterium Bs31]|nr:replication restart DNA helicase PriA [Alteromonadaceae bacterium Bs31]
MTKPPSQATYCSVALPVPLRRLFEYQLPILENNIAQSFIGRRVEVKFGQQLLIGLVLSVQKTATYDPSKIKPVETIIDSQPVLPLELLSLCQWAARYYHHPVGETISTALPQALRHGKPGINTRPAWRLSTEGKGLPETALARAPKQQQALQYLLKHSNLSAEAAAQQNISNATLQAMSKKGLIEKTELVLETLNSGLSGEQLLSQESPALTAEQQVALDQIRYHQFNTYLLEGATGSGKTEVYLQMVARVLQAGKQALILIPEIGLTPQTVMRVRQRFNCEVAELHSNVSEAKRAQNWLAARDGCAHIIIGTRLASLSPMRDLGLIIIDEEHDLSFKQQDGLRYSARDLSIYRASKLNIPVVLGSATPSLESLHNAIHGRYQHLRLTKRAGVAKPPSIHLVDLRQKALTAGLCQDAISAIANTLSNGHQVMIFINRRGYAPTLLCHNCGWHAGCRNCDAQLTLHRSPPHLHCHHCGRQQAINRHCPECNNHQLTPKGLGTEQTEQWLQAQFPQVQVIRVDRDSTQRKQALSEYLEVVAKGEPCILIGTQMLAKGHHLPKIALVVVVDCDQGLLSADFRGPERMGQLITQVAGRAGREEIAGTVLIQSHTPDHPLLELLLSKGYHLFARELLKERQISKLPPITYMAMFRAESKRAEIAREFLSMVGKTFVDIAPPSPSVRYLGPIPSRMEKVNERYRYQFQLMCDSRAELQQVLDKALERIDQHALSKRARWSVDVDALEV